MRYNAKTQHPKPPRRPNAHERITRGGKRQDDKIVSFNLNISRYSHCFLEEFHVLDELLGFIAQSQGWVCPGIPGKTTPNPVTDTVLTGNYD